MIRHNKPLDLWLSIISSLMNASFSANSSWDSSSLSFLCFDFFSICSGTDRMVRPTVWGTPMTVWPTLRGTLAMFRTVDFAVDAIFSIVVIGMELEMNGINGNYVDKCALVIGFFFYVTCCLEFFRRIDVLTVRCWSFLFFCHPSACKTRLRFCCCTVLYPVPSIDTEKGTDGSVPVGLRACGACVAIFRQTDQNVNQYHTAGVGWRSFSTHGTVYSWACHVVHQSSIIHYWPSNYEIPTTDRLMHL